jgi:hypothetical protein
MHEKGVTKFFTIAGKHMQHFSLPLLWMPAKIKTAVVTDTATDPNKFVLVGYAIGQSAQGL